MVTEEGCFFGAEGVGDIIAFVLGEDNAFAGEDDVVLWST
jgi:hypothetical protein